MKEVTIQVDQLVYEAVDGTRFESKEECKAYEKTAKGVIMGRFKKLIVAEHDSWDLHWGMDDNTTYMLKLKTKEDADAALQALLLENGWILSKDREDDLARWTDTINSTVGKDDDYLLVGANYEGDIYFMGTFSQMINKFKKIFNDTSI